MVATSSPFPVVPSGLSYRRDDWQRGYESQEGEFDYWLEPGEITGQLPADLQGTLFRNGPGRFTIGSEPIAHPFDGDGMVCKIVFESGRVHFSNRYVRTEGFLAESAAGKILYRGVFGTQKAGGWLANLFDLKMKNIANTNVIYWGQKLLALWEGAEPYRLDPKTLATIGIDRLEGVLKPDQAFSAHPRVDPGLDLEPNQGPSQGQNPWQVKTGDRCLVNFSVKPGPLTKIETFEFNEAGALLDRRTHAVPGFAFLHDMVITPNWCIFFQNPVQLNPWPFVFGLRGAGQCLDFDPGQPTRILLLPRPGNPQPMKVLETEACFVFHHANAFEEVAAEGTGAGTGAIVVDSICYDVFPTVEPGTDFLAVDFSALPKGQLRRYHLDLKTNRVTSRLIEGRSCEFPTVHPNCVGRSHRYLYLVATDQPEGNAPLQAIVKVDNQTGDRQIYSFAPRGFATEPVFVPRPGATAEDDGWLLVLVYRGDRHASDLAIFAADTIDAGPIATIHLRQHIPYGLHGCFTTDSFAPTSP